MWWQQLTADGLFFFSCIQRGLPCDDMQATATRGPREEASITLAALWRTSQKLKALFRGSNITNKLLVSNPAHPHFLAPTAIDLPSLRRAPPLVFAPLSTAAALAVNPSSNASPLRNAAAKGLAGAHVSLPYRLWAGSTQSCRILPTFPLQQAGRQSLRRLPSLTIPLSLPSFLLLRSSHFANFTLTCACTRHRSLHASVFQTQRENLAGASPGSCLEIGSTCRCDV